LAHALIIAIAKLDNNTNYAFYCDGRNIRPIVRKLLVKLGIDLSAGGGIIELRKFQEYFVEYKITVCVKTLFEGQIDPLRELIYSLTMSNDTITRS